MSEETVQETAQIQESTQQSSQDSTLLHEVMAKKEKIQNLTAKNNDLVAEIEAMKNAELEKQGNLQELVDKMKSENQSLKENAEKWMKYESDTRSELLNKIPEDKREKWMNADIPILKDYVETITVSQPKNVNHVPNAARNTVYANQAELASAFLKGEITADQYVKQGKDF